MMMRFCLLPFLFLTGVALAAEPVTLPLELGTLKTIGVGSRTYDGVKIIGTDAVGIKISHEGGISRIAYDRLPRELAARFAVDTEAAQAQLQKEAQEGAAHERAMREAEQQVQREKKKDEPEKAGTWEEDYEESLLNQINGREKPDSTGKTDPQRIAALKIYVERLKKDVKEADERLKRRMATRARVKTSYYGDSDRARERAAEKNSKTHGKTLEEVHPKQAAALQQATKKLEDAEYELYRLQRAK